MPSSLRDQVTAGRIVGISGRAAAVERAFLGDRQRPVVFEPLDEIRVRDEHTSDRNQVGAPVQGGQQFVRTACALTVGLMPTLCIQVPRQLSAIQPSIAASLNAEVWQ